MSNSNSSIEGVWKMVLSISGRSQEMCPLPVPDGSKVYLSCFSNGKVFGAAKVTESKNPSEDGFYKVGEGWNTPYKFIADTLVLEDTVGSFIISGDEAKFECDADTTLFQRVKSPTVKEIMALTREITKNMMP